MYGLWFLATITHSCQKEAVPERQRRKKQNVRLHSGRSDAFREELVSEMFISHRKAVRKKEVRPPRHISLTYKAVVQAPIHYRDKGHLARHNKMAIFENYASHG